MIEPSLYNAYFKQNREKSFELSPIDFRDSPGLTL